MCGILNIDTYEAHDLLAVLFAKQKIRPVARSIYIGNNKRMPQVFWVVTTGKKQKLSADSVRKRKERKQLRANKVQVTVDPALKGRLSTSQDTKSRVVGGKLLVDPKDPYE